MSDYFKILEQLPGAYICWKDENSVFRGCNQAFADLIGQSKEAIIGSTDQLSEKHVRDDREVRETGHAKLAMHETIPGPDGQDIAIITNKGPWFDDSGKVIGTIVVFVKAQ